MRPLRRILIRALASSQYALTARLACSASLRLYGHLLLFRKKARCAITFLRVCVCGAWGLGQSPNRFPRRGKPTALGAEAASATGRANNHLSIISLSPASTLFLYLSRGHFSHLIAQGKLIFNKVYRDISVLCQSRGNKPRLRHLNIVFLAFNAVYLL